MPVKKKVYKYLRIALLTVIVSSPCPNPALTLEQPNPATDDTVRLIVTVMQKNIGRVNGLLAEGVDVNRSASDGMKPLFAAALTGSTEIARLLLDNGAKIDAAVKGITALHAASFNCHTETVKLLIDEGADINAALKGTINISPPRSGLLNAWEINSLEQSSNPGQPANQASGNMSLWDMPYGGSMDSSDVKFTGDYFSGSSQFGTPIRSDFAALMGQSVGSTPLIIAAEKGHTEIVRLLLDARAKVNKKNVNDDTALMLASVEGHTQIVMLLLDAGAKIEAKRTDGSNAILLASAHGHTEIIRLLLDAGAKLESKTKFGIAILTLDSVYSDREFIKLLLDAGTKVNDDLKNSDSKLHISGLTRTISINVENIGDHAYLTNMGKSTPLILASQNGHVETVRILLDAGAKIDSRTENGATALMLAAENGHTEIVRLLLEAGAKTDATMKIEGERYTALDLAEFQKYTEIIRLLKKYGSKN